MLNTKLAKYLAPSAAFYVANVLMADERRLANPVGGLYEVVAGSFSSFADRLSEKFPTGNTHAISVPVYGIRKDYTSNDALESMLADNSLNSGLNHFHNPGFKPNRTYTLSNRPKRLNLAMSPRGKRPTRKLDRSDSKPNYRGHKSGHLAVFKKRHR